ncbi:GTPase domain-containing protein [Eubacteriaceae bacterium ES3]|nr:GTPase domain-containing protein [Eubacteriaceae bacterium ES3]
MEIEKSTMWGNVLVIGNQEVGKSTLIQAVLGDETTEKGWGPVDDIDELDIFESQVIPFRLVETVCFEPSIIKQQKTINAIKKWTKEGVKEGHNDNQINVIWFCVDATNSKEFKTSMKDLSKATSTWKSVPVIVVITKSFALPERDTHIELMNQIIESKEKAFKNLRKIIPVVASVYVLNETAFAPPMGIAELIDATNVLMPEGIQKGKLAVSKFILNRKRAMAHSLVGAATAAGATVGAVPTIPSADAFILVPIEMGLIKGVGSIYGIKDDENSKMFFNTIVDVGTVSLVAKGAIGTLKLIPGINLAAIPINAIIAGAIVAAIGEGAIYVFEKIYLGEKSLADIDWVRKVMEEQLSSGFIEKMTPIIEKVSKDPKDIGKVIPDLLAALFKGSDNKKEPEEQI